MKKLVTIILAAAAACIFSITAFAAKTETAIPTATLNKVLEDYRTALKNGSSHIDLSGYGIADDSSHSAYSELFLYFMRANGDLGSISFGKYSETIASSEIETDRSTGMITGVKIEYTEHYRKADGSCDTAQLDKDRALIADRFQKAKSLAKRGMSDAEKALMYYDLVITLADYPDPTGFNEYGDEIYPDEVYTASGLLRDGFAVCTAYAKLYAILLNEAGVKAVTVDSDTIDHEWVMVQIDGEWYHCDPTWDDLRYEEGMTALWDNNNDNWDIGAVSHYYFLKSDEEIISLSHPDWEISYTVNPDSLDSAPVSGPSEQFGDKFFSETNSEYLNPGAFNYINGNWYFTDLISNSVVVTPFDGEPELIPLPDGEIPKYSFSYNNSLYVCTNYCVFRFDPVSATFEKILQAPSGLYDYSEMCIRFDEMTLIVSQYSFDSDAQVTDTDFEVTVYSMSDIENMDTIAEENTVEVETISRADVDDDTAPILTRPGGSSERNTMSDGEKRMLENAQVTGKRVSSFIYLGIAVIFIGFGLVAVVLAIKYSKKK